MNKVVLFASVCAICACFSVSASAGTCNGGVVVKGVQNNHEYCRSSTTMLWWAAFQWCQEQGRHLVTVQEACVDWRGEMGDNACPNLMIGDDRWIWTANPNGSSAAYYVNLSSGNISNNGARTQYHRYTLCF